VVVLNRIVVKSLFVNLFTKFNAGKMDLEEFIEFIDYVNDDTPYNYPERRYIRDAENPMEFYDNEEFRRRFRFSKNTVHLVLMPLVFNNQQLSGSNNRGLPIPPIFQLLLTLRFYATGNFQVST
jgi:hypothetical protein